MAYTIFEQVKLRLRQFHTETSVDEDGVSNDLIVFDKSDDDAIILQLIEEAKRDVAMARNYPSGYTDDKIALDLEKQENIIVKLVLYDFVKDGAEFEVSYRINESSAEYVSRDSILATVTPFVHFL